MARPSLTWFVAALLLASTLLAVAAAGAQGCGPWETASVPSEYSAVTVTWGDGQFIALGNGVWSSVDGRAWSQISRALDWGGYTVAVVWTGSQYIAVGWYWMIATSSDGISWTVRNEPWTSMRPSGFRGIACSPSLCVAVGRSLDESLGLYTSKAMVSSIDGVTWAWVPLERGSDQEELNDIVWTGQQFVAVGHTQGIGLVLTSPDGRNWSRQTGPGGYAVAWSGREIVAVTGGSSWSGKDGTAWQQGELPTIGGVPRIAWAGSEFVCVDDRGAIATSRDGRVWSSNSLPAQGYVSGIAWSGREVVVVGGTGVSYRSACTRPNGVLYLPASAHLAGINASSWRTNLEVHNGGAAQAGYTIELLERDADNGAPASHTFKLDPGVSARYPDALGSLFGFTGAATLRITPYDGTLMAGARTYSDAQGGSFGQYVEGIAESQAVTFGKNARIIQLSQSADRSSGFRTNVGLVSASPSPMTVEVELYRADGSLLGKLSYALRSYESIQRNEIFREVTAEAIEDGYAIVRTNTESGEFFAYATVIDNRTNDPVYIPAR